jgi:hypothetical protein
MVLGDQPTVRRRKLEHLVRIFYVKDFFMN